MTEHDRAFDPAAQIGGQQQLTVRRHQIRAEPGAAADLGQQGPAPGASEFLGLGAGAGSRDDHGARTARDEEYRFGAVGGQDGLGEHSSRFGESGRARDQFGRQGDRGRQRLPEGKVQLHRTRVERAEAGRGIRCPAGQGDGGARLGARAVRCGLIDAQARRHAEQAGLQGGLVRADAAQLARPVGRQQDHGHPRVVRLEHRGVEVRHGRARGADDQRRPAGLDG